MQNKSELLAEKVAIVTGAGRGIGRGIAKVFAEHGAKVVVATRTAKYGEKTVEEIKAAGGEARLLVTELQNKNEVERIVSLTLEKFGRLDIVVHNAALAKIEYFEALNDQMLDDCYALNIKAGIWLAQAALAPMKEAGAGRILFTSSVTSSRAIHGATAYAISKAGVNALIRSAALELSPYNITVNGVEPGLIETSALEKHQLSERQKEQLLGCVPMRRMGLPEEIGAAMLFLASDLSSYMTGQTIVVDGGMLLPENGASLLQKRNIIS